MRCVSSRRVAAGATPDSAEMLTLHQSVCGGTHPRGRLQLACDYQQSPQPVDLTKIDRAVLQQHASTRT